MKQHSPRFLQLVNTAKVHVNEINPAELNAKIKSGEHFHLIDVREKDEYETGHIPDAIHLSKGVIERDIEKKIPDTDAEIVVYCSGGFRAVLVADNLQKMGYSCVKSLNGGFSAWSLEN